MQSDKKIPHDFLVRIISAYAEPPADDPVCVPHVVENTLEVLAGFERLIGIEGGRK